MRYKSLFAIGLLLGLSSGLAAAQTTAPGPTRNPVLGDPGTKNPSARPSAAAEAKADKQPRGTEDGNQPDRAAAGGGAR